MVIEALGVKNQRWQGVHKDDVMATGMKNCLYPGKIIK